MQIRLLACGGMKAAEVVSTQISHAVQRSSLHDALVMCGAKEDRAGCAGFGMRPILFLAAAEFA
jgi:hypothetical protein